MKFESVIDYIILCNNLGTGRERGLLMRQVERIQRKLKQRVDGGYQLHTKQDCKFMINSYKSMCVL